MPIATPSLWMVAQHSTLMRTSFSSSRIWLSDSCSYDIGRSPLSPSLQTSTLATRAARCPGKVMCWPSSIVSSAFQGFVGAIPGGWEVVAREVGALAVDVSAAVEMEAGYVVEVGTRG